MRNWNSISPGRSLPLTQFLDYLWGIETLLPVPLWSLFLVFLDYLWGIETPRLRPPAFPSWLFLDYLWGIETKSTAGHSGENRRVFRLPMRNWNTYQHSYNQLLPFVFRLPMRNWNLLPQPRRTRSYKFLDYLWGIETKKYWYSEEHAVWRF